MNEPVSLPAPTAPASPAATLALDLEIRELIVRTAQMLGYPKSVGEIYALLYVAREPLSADQIRDQLHLSLGSASQGLKTLRDLRAVRPVYRPGLRKDFYQAETFIRHLAAAFIREEVRPLLERGAGHVGRLEDLVEDLDDSSAREHYRNRVNQIKNIHQAAKRLLPLLQKFLQA